MLTFLTSNEPLTEYKVALTECVSTPGEVLNKVLYRGALLQGPTRYSFIHHFWRLRYTFRVPSIFCGQMISLRHT